MESLSSILETCRNHLTSGLYLDAIGHINEHLFNDPYSSQAWSMLGLLWFEARKFGFAADAFERAEKIEALNVSNKIKYTICKIILNDHFATDRVLIEMRRAIVDGGGSRFVHPKLEDAFVNTKPLPVLFQGSPNQGVFITVDDGPNINSTHIILNALKTYPDIRANFFASGKSLSQTANVDVLRAIVNDGHSLHSHGYSHNPFTMLDRQTIFEELSRTEGILSLVRPTPNPYYIRLPGGMGWNSEAVHEAVRSWNNAAVLVHWTIDPQDYNADKSMYFSRDPILEAKVRALEAFLDPSFGSGGILLTHDKMYGAGGVVDEIFLLNYFNFLIRFCRILSIRTQLIDKVFFEDRFENEQDLIVSPIVQLSQNNIKTDPSAILEPERFDPELIKIDADNFPHFSGPSFQNVPVSLIKKIKDRGWTSHKYPIAYLLMVGNRCVGCLFAIYANRNFNGECHIVCNISTWWVEEDYRFASMRLLFSLLLDAKDVTVSIFTPSITVEKIYKSAVMKFDMLDNERAIFKLNTSFDASVDLIKFEPNSVVSTQFTIEEIGLLNDNYSEDIDGFILASSTARCFFIARSRIRNDINVWDILYLAGDATLMRKIWKNNNQIFSTDDHFIIDKRFFSSENSISFVSPPTGRYVRFPTNKPHGFVIDFLYSEIVVFNSSLL